LAREFEDPYTLKTLFISLVRPKLEYASCIWDPIYEVHSAKIERVQGKFIKYALRSLGWTDPLNLPPYENRCRLINLDTLAERRNKACVMFVFDVLSGKIDAPPILVEIRLNVLIRTNYSYRTCFFTFRIYEIHKGKYWFHPKNFEIFFLLKSRFLPIKSHKT
jgi:hypothetical protein